MNKKEILLISVIIFLSAIFWLIADIYHAATEEKIKEKITLPEINKYEINTQILKVLEERKP